MYLRGIECTDWFQHRVAQNLGDSHHIECLKFQNTPPGNPRTPTFPNRVHICHFHNLYTIRFHSLLGTCPFHKHRNVFFRQCLPSQQDTTHNFLEQDRWQTCPADKSDKLCFQSNFDKILCYKRNTTRVPLRHTLSGTICTRIHE